MLRLVDCDEKKHSSIPKNIIIIIHTLFQSLFNKKLEFQFNFTSITQSIILMMRGLPQILLPLNNRQDNSIHNSRFLVYAAILKVY